MGGRVIGGRYLLCGEIAAGGMATIHLARQIGAAGFARIVAIKRLHERFGKDPEFVAMFLDEARLVARIHHPNVVSTIDVVAENGEVFIVMEYVQGESLLRAFLLSRRVGAPVPISIATAVLSNVLHGLHEAHEAKNEAGVPLGIVHRDVSPHNILVGSDGIARVLDFGVAKAAERIQSTHEGQLKGKLSYMAPEQVRGAPIDRRTDVFAAAVVFWEALAGTKLFGGTNEAAVLSNVLSEPIRPASALNRAVTPELDAVVMRGLTRDPNGRFSTAREMAMALERAAPVATASAVGAWIAQTCADTLVSRARIIAKIEATTSSESRREAEVSLRQITASGSRGSDLDAVERSGRVQTVPPPHFGPSPPAPVRSFPPPTYRRDHLPKDGSNAAVPRQAGAHRLVAAFAIAALTTLVAVIGGATLYLAKVRGPTGLLPAAAPSDTAVASPGAMIVASTDAMSASSAVVTTLGCPPEMTRIPGGRFFMGSDDDLPAEKPAHKVTLRAYCMDKREVTAIAYRACSDRGDCKRAGTTNKWQGFTAKDARTYDSLCTAADAAKGTHPINCVDWGMAARFCKAEGKRLPTEAEWEFAARGSDGRRYPWGDAPPSPRLLNACGTECVSWGKKHAAPLEGMYDADDGFATTAPVGSFPLGASRWGIEDVVGNVWEWTSDFYGAYVVNDQDDPKGPSEGATRVIRGGAWNGAYPDWVRPTFRFHDAPDTRSHGIGFRCAKD